jgi:hypothetical protein
VVRDGIVGDADRGTGPDVKTLRPESSGDLAPARHGLPACGTSIGWAKPMPLEAPPPSASAHMPSAAAPCPSSTQTRRSANEPQVGDRPGGEPVGVRLGHHQRVLAQDDHPLGSLGFCFSQASNPARPPTPGPASTTFSLNGWPVGP